jgi:hypothetical protein
MVFENAVVLLASGDQHVSANNACAYVHQGDKQRDSPDGKQRFSAHESDLSSRPVGGTNARSPALPASSVQFR